MKKLIAMDEQCSWMQSNTVKSNAIRCNQMQFSAIKCNRVQFLAIKCSLVPLGA